MQKLDFAVLMQAEFADVPVPELNGTVRVKKMQARDHLELERLYLSQGVKGVDADGNETLSIRPAEIAALKVRLCVVDDDGKPVFDENTVWDLGKDALFAVFAAVNAYTDNAAAADVEDAAKK